MYKAIIIDDEEMARTLLQGMVAEYCDNVETVELCKDLPIGVKAIRKHKPEIGRAHV
jgi:two-component system LytT family response regulator